MISWLELTTKPSVTAPGRQTQGRRLARRFISEDSWGQRDQCLSEKEGGGSGQREEWAAMQSQKDALPKGSSEAGMTFQSCLELGQRDHAFIPCTDQSLAVGCPREGA